MSPPSALRAARTLLLHLWKEEIVRGTLAFAKLDFVEGAICFKRAETYGDGVKYFADRLKAVA